MAFLCPVRIRRGKKKKNQDADDGLTRPASGLGLNHGMGRITGSASIETLVRVGIEKEIGLSPDSKMVVLYNFVPCVDDELEVKRGQIVNILYRENDWVYVIGQDSPRSEGFIPHSYCAPYNTAVADMAIKKKLPREVSLDQTELAQDGLTTAEVVDENSIGPLQGSLKNSQASLTTSEPDFFSKDPSGRFIVLYTFIARDENDVSVERGEFVTVLNREDPEWYWVVRSDGSEGFIPSGFVFVYPGENILQANKTNSTTTPLNQHNGSNLSTTNSNNNTNNSLTFQQQQQPGADDLRYHGTELVMLYDYKAQAPDDLSVRRGDWIYADLNNQTVEGWLWAYSPKTRKYGFIPKAYARPPAMTSL